VTFHRAGLELLEDVVAGARLLRRLPAWFRHPITPPTARGILRRRLAEREPDFLAVVRGTVYWHPGSPYRRLLALAGCEYGDLERLVSQAGVEGALEVLFRQGVYLSVDELKGRRPVVRGTTTLDFHPDQLTNPLADWHVPGDTSGSRGQPVLVQTDLGFIRDFAVDLCVFLDARRGLDWQHAFWEVPGGAAMTQVIETAGIGARVHRWFSQIDPASRGLHLRYRLGPRLTRWGSVLTGARLPMPEHVSLDDPAPIVRWLRAVREAGGTPHLKTYGSSAVRLALRALELGVDLSGAQISVSGEPITEARLATIRKSGADAVPRWGSRECGPIGYGCLDPDAPDDLHLLHDLHAFIQAGPGTAPGFPPSAVLVSTLRSTAPLILLNVALGDQAVVHRRACGCPLAALGWTTHVHTIRSYGRLTGGGMAVLDSDVIRVLDEVLPARFGGSPTDYQVVEEIGPDGEPLLRLLVHPRLGALAADVVVRTFLDALGVGSGADRLMAAVWNDIRMVRVERQPPLVAASGKILHWTAPRRPRSTSDPEGP
jgi:hypothetical protein